MRCVLPLVLLAGCDLYWGSDKPHGDPPLGDSCSDPAPPGQCQCSNGTWFCNTCPFFETHDSVACSPDGIGCDLETWEHGCSCGCVDGWWSCTPETIGSTCPSGPPDAGIDAGPVPPDAPFPDAAPCSRIEAEYVGVHPSWVITTGIASNGMALEADVGGAAFTFDFTGTALAMGYEIGPNNGTYTIAIDGGAPISIDAFHANDFEETEKTLASGLANTTHSVHVICATARCSVDYFDPTCP